MTRTQVFLPVNVRDATGMLKCHDTALEHTLTTTGKYDGLSLGFGHSGVRLDATQLMLLPLDKAYGCLGTYQWNSPLRKHEATSLGSQHVKQRGGEVIGQACKVHALQPGTIRSKRRILFRQVTPEFRHVVSGSHGMSQLGEGNIETPADVVPVRACLAELQGLWGLVGM